MACNVFHVIGYPAPAGISLLKKARGRRAANEVCVIAPSDLFRRQARKAFKTLLSAKKLGETVNEAPDPMQVPNKRE